MNAETNEPRVSESGTNKRSLWRWGVALLIAVGGIAVIRAVPGTAKAAARPEKSESVAVARITRADLFKEITVPADFWPFSQVELHAKVSGYLDKINVDIGDEVKAGQLLATLEVPELRNELARAKATEKRTEADYKAAHLTRTRLEAVNKDHPNLVAQQDLDAAEAKDGTTEAAIADAKAEVDRIQTLLSYTRITAPFDGVVTHRFADPGALIQAGTASDTQSKPVVCLSDNYHLRLRIRVPVDIVKEVKLQDSVEVRVESAKGKAFEGKISRVTQKVDEDTRTMIAEVDVPNPKLELIPGMYATAILKVDRQPGVLTIPIEAISAGKTTVFVINERQELEERKLVLGIESQSMFEVVSGLKEGDMVAIGSRSQFKPGQKVEPRAIQLIAQP